MIHDELTQWWLFILSAERLNNGAFGKLSFKIQWFPCPDKDGHDRSNNYYDRICLN